MSLTDLRSKTGRKRNKRLGRGNGSGHGTYSCRGGKGQTARTGGNRRPGFEGGQTPFTMRMPKLRGFKNPNYQAYQPVNIGELNIFEDNSTVDIPALFKKKLICKKNEPVKLLAGKGELTKKLTVIVHKASAKAKEMLESKQGKLELLKTPAATTEQ